MGTICCTKWPKVRSAIVKNYFFEVPKRCTDTSDLRLFGTMCLMPKCLTFLRWCRIRHQYRSVWDSSTLKCMRHFGPRIKICFECRHCVKKVDPLYIRYCNEWRCLENDWQKLYLTSLLTCEQSRIVGNEHSRSGVMQLQWAEMRRRMRR